MRAGYSPCGRLCSLLLLPPPALPLLPLLPPLLPLLLPPLLPLLRPILHLHPTWLIVPYLKVLLNTTLSEGCRVEPGMMKSEVTMRPRLHS